MPDNIYEKFKKLIGKAESSGRHRNKDGSIVKNSRSSAKGRYQIIDSTWRKVERELDRNFSMNNEQDSEIVMNHLLKNYTNGLKSQGLPINATSLYMMHFKGDVNWVKKAFSNPNAPTSSAFSRAELEANPWLPKTLGGVTASLAKKVGDDPSQYRKETKTDRTAATHEAWTKYRSEISAAKKLSGSKSIDEQERINKKYASEGWFGVKNDGTPYGSFNRIIQENNKTNEINTKNDAEAAFLVANNLDHFLNMQVDKQGNRKPSLKYTEKNKKNFIDSNSSLELDLKKINPTDKQALERVLGRDLKGDSVKIPTVELLKKTEAQVNRFVSPEKQIDLINQKTNARGKDLAFENPINHKDSKGSFSPSKVYIPDFEKGNQGIGLGGELMLTNTYEPRNFKYNPSENYAYKKDDYLSVNPNWGVSPTAVDEAEAAYTDEETYSGDTPMPDYTSKVANIKSTVTAMPTQEKDPIWEAYKEKNRENFKNLTEEQIRKNFEDYLKNQPKDTSIADMMSSFANAEAPDQSSYNPDMFKEDIPYGELAVSAMGILNGQKMAGRELPVRDETVSAAFLNYGSELARLSQIGLRPEEEAYAKRMLSESYSSSVEQLQSAANGNRNIVLGNLGRLDYQKQEGLLKIALADASAKNEAFYKYGEAMKYISEFDANRDVANNEREYQNAMLTKQAGGAMMSSGWKSMMDNIQYYKDNKPGSANHAYKSYMMQKMFEVDPNIKDDGTGNTPGTLSYKKKKDADSMAAFANNKEVGTKFMNLPLDKQQEFQKIAIQYGWNSSLPVLDYMAKNPKVGALDFAKVEEASKNGDWSSAFSGGQSSTEVAGNTQPENILDKINPTFQTTKDIKPVESRFGFLQEENQKAEKQSPFVIPEFGKLPNANRAFGVFDSMEEEERRFGFRNNNKNFSN